MKTNSFWTSFKKNFWFKPTVYTLVAVILAYGTYLIDALYANGKSKVIPSIFLTDFDLASTIISTISSSILTMTTITFSSILVVLTTFLSQYTPRSVQNLINDTPTQRVLAAFASSYVYTLILLLLLKGGKKQEFYLSPSFAVIAAIICVFVFVYFVHHVANWVKVSNLIHQITQKTSERIRTSLPIKENQKGSDDHSDRMDRFTYILHSLKGGFIQRIDRDAIINQADNDQASVKILYTTGQYVLKGTPIIAANSEINKEKYLGFIKLGPDKEPIEDIDLGIRKLAEIAMRAISPAINDPNTAIDCIEQMGLILSKLSNHSLPGDYFYKNGQLRLILKQPDFNEYLYKSFYQIRHYGKNDISVITEIIKALHKIVLNGSPSIKETIWEFKDYILNGVNYEALLPLDIDYLLEHVNRLAEECSKPKLALDGFSKKYIKNGQPH
ncbi:DUF2254 domain-containing protein [Falsibacillus pallidus]|uniref:Putative membrane protein n=1 Tax=Falsibacillus pallidus TaxID=493781 RepID=A0A370GVH4_9BACI|nr:DUF2254 domain-containing protein [Falsibacillus pallidus]RDI47667.1 putative membrane protein [Falsibacillus pallidus]